MCMVVTVAHGPHAICATDTRVSAFHPDGRVERRDEGGKLVGFPGGWMSATSTGGAGRLVRAAFAAVEREQPPTLEDARRLVTQSSFDVDGRARFYVTGIQGTLGRTEVWDGIGSFVDGGTGGCLHLAAPFGVDPDTAREARQSLLADLAGADGIEAVLRAVGRRFLEMSKISDAISSEVEVGIVLAGRHQVTLAAEALAGGAVRVGR